VSFVKASCTPPLEITHCNTRQQDHHHHIKQSTTPNQQPTKIKPNNRKEKLDYRVRTRRSSSSTV